MHLVELLLGRLFLAGELELRMQLHPRDRQLAVLILLHVTDGFIGVFVEQELLFAGDGEKREHVAARERSDKRFLRIDILRVAEIGRGGRRRPFRGRRRISRCDRGCKFGTGSRAWRASR